MVDSSSDDDNYGRRRELKTLLNAVYIRAAKRKQRLQPFVEIIGTWGL